MNFQQKLKQHIKNVEKNYILSQCNQRYKFPRNNDKYNYSPDRSYTSLEGDTVNLNEQNKRNSLKMPIHRRLNSQQQSSHFTEAVRQYHFSFSPYKKDQFNKTKSSQKSPPQVLLIQSKVKPNRKLIPKGYVSTLKQQCSQMTLNSSQITLKGRRMKTETYENITKYRLTTTKEY